MAARKSGVVFLDCRSESAYRESHMAGALRLPVDYWLKEDDGNGIARGNHIIEQQDFEKHMGSLGLTKDASIFVYDDNHNKGAARFWWVARYFGLIRVRIIDGGWQQILKMGLPLSCNIEPQIVTQYRAVCNPDMLIHTEVLRDCLDHYQLVDARSDGEWFGEELHGNPRGGRIPGAAHIEWSLFLSDRSPFCFKSGEEIRDIAVRANLNPDKPIVTYCQAGIRASVAAVAFVLAGFRDVRVNEESMYEWSRWKDAPLIGNNAR